MYVDNQIDWRCIDQQRSSNFINPTTNTIAFDSALENLFTNYNRHTRMMTMTINYPFNSKKFTPSHLPMSQHISKTIMPMKTVFTRNHISILTKNALSSDFLDCDFSPRFIAATFQNSLPALAGHTSAKSVHFGTLARLWLICSLWHNARYCSRLCCFCQILPNLINFSTKIWVFSTLLQGKMKIVEKLTTIRSKISQIHEF